MNQRLSITWGLRGYRVLVLLAIFWLVRQQSLWFQAQVSPREKPALEEVRNILPGAAAWGAIDPAMGGWEIKDAGGLTIGFALETFPEAEEHVGYAGPTNTLIVLNQEGTIVGASILSSRDTKQHVGDVKQNQSFWNRFVGVRKGESLPAGIQGVAGSTLTSLAIVETIGLRITQAEGGRKSSLRFPQELTVEDASLIFPGAVGLGASREDGLYPVSDAAGVLLGLLARSAPYSDEITGYQGPTDCLLGFDPSGEILQHIRIRKTYDNEEYVAYVREDRHYLKSFQERSLATLAQLDFAAEGIEGVSGATRTSYAIAEGLRLRCQALVQEREAAKIKVVTARQWWPEPRFLWLLGFTLSSLVIAFTRLKGFAWVRRIWQLALVGYVLFTGADVLSLALLVGWTTGKAALWAMPSVLYLVALSYLIPWTTRKQWYCHHFCPLGALQQMAQSLSPWRWNLPKSLIGWFEKIPAVMLFAALFLLAAGYSPDFAAWEAFDAFWFRVAGWTSLALGLGGLILSAFIPLAYCRFACPTGALLKFVRSKGNRETFGKGEWLAGVCLAVCLVAYFNRDWILRTFS